MKIIKFYVEYPTNRDKRQGTRKELGNHTGNCIAVIAGTCRVNNQTTIIHDAIGAVYFVENSDCASTEVAECYLAKFCKRISEKQAREIHPALFKYLDD